MKKTITFFALLMFMLCTFRCTKGDILPYFKDLTIDAKYANPLNGAPSLEIDNTSVSAPVKFNANQLPIATTSNGRVFLTLPNVRFQDELGVYDVYNVVTEEFRNGKWEADAENFLKVTRTKKLQYVLVLDMSSSLGSDITNVKNYATQMINFIGRENSTSQVGVVLFSGTVTKLPLTANYSTAIGFVNNGTGGNETKLYEAIDAGIDILKNATTVPDGRALIVFTDGKNNAQSNLIYENEEFVKNRLKQTIGSDKGYISTYTIGLDGKQGGVDQSSLQNLALNGGISQVANSSDKLAGVFEKIRNFVSTVYDLTYDRNSSKISSSIQLRFTVKTSIK